MSFLVFDVSVSGLKVLSVGAVLSIKQELSWLSGMKSATCCWRKIAEEFLRREAEITIGNNLSIPERVMSRKTRRLGAETRK